MTSGIDFSKLLREEKRRARRQRCQQKVEGDENPITSSPTQTEESSPKISELLPSWCSTDQKLSFSNLNLQLISSNPKSIYYSSKALNDTKALERWLQSLPSGDRGLGEWKTMKFGKRRAAMFGETIYYPLVGPLKEIASLLLQEGIFSKEEPPNHVLLNEYQPSQGILPHTDGPLYASRTATISLLSSVILEFSRRLGSEEIGRKEVVGVEEPIQVLLEPGSLIVFEDDA
jgi:alkylated DNA repair protein alkB family protein 6